VYHINQYGEEYNHKAPHFTQFSSVCYLFSSSPTYLPRRPILEHPQRSVSTYIRKVTFTVAVSELPRDPWVGLLWYKNNHTERGDRTHTCALIIAHRDFESIGSGSLPILLWSQLETDLICDILTLQSFGKLFYRRFEISGKKCAIIRDSPYPVAAKTRAVALGCSLVRWPRRLKHLGYPKRRKCNPQQ
jgi:hypothetical protein